MRKLPVYNIIDFGQAAREPDLYVNTFREHIAQHDHLILTPHRHSHYVSMFFTQGRGSQEIDFHTYEIKPGCVFLIFPGQVHHWKVRDDCDGYIIFHKNHFYEHAVTEAFPFRSGTEPGPAIRVPGKWVPGITAQFRGILDEYRHTKPMRIPKIAALLNVLYIDLSRVYMPDGKNKVPDMHAAHIRRLDLLIELHFREIKSPAKYAALMFMTGKHLNRICQVSLGRTMTEVLIDRVVLEAKRMLAHTTMTVSAIAENLGYEDRSYFTRLFKKHTGETPVEFQASYRKRHRT